MKQSKQKRLLSIVLTLSMFFGLFANVIPNLSSVAASDTETAKISTFGDKYYYYGRTNAEFFEDSFDMNAMTDWTEATTPVGRGTPATGHPAIVTELPQNNGAGPSQYGSPQHRATYFKKSFDMPADFDASNIVEVTGTFRNAHNFIMYVNGKEIFRVMANSLKDTHEVIGSSIDWSVLCPTGTANHQRDFEILDSNVGTALGAETWYSTSMTNLEDAIVAGENVLTCVMWNPNGSSRMYLDLDMTVEYELLEEDTSALIPRGAGGIVDNDLYTMLVNQYAMAHNEGEAIAQVEAGEPAASALMTIAEARKIINVHGAGNPANGPWAGGVASLEGISFLENLEIFRTNASRVTTIPTEISKLTNLKHFQVSGVAENAGLKIDLSNGALKPLTAAGTNLESINLSRSGITDPMEFANYLGDAKSPNGAKTALTLQNMSIDWGNATASDPKNRAVIHFMTQAPALGFASVNTYADAPPAPNWGDPNTTQVPNDGSVIASTTGDHTYEAIRRYAGNNFTYDAAARLGFLDMNWFSANENLKGLHEVCPNLVLLVATNCGLANIDALAELKKYTDTGRLKVKLAGNAVNNSGTHWNSPEGQRFLWDTKDTLEILDLHADANVPTYDPAFDQPIPDSELPDVNFRNYVRNTFGTDGQITYKQALEVTNMTKPANWDAVTANTKIQSIEGIGFFANITTLELRGEILEFLPSDIAKCTKLETLNVRDNNGGAAYGRLEKLEHISKLTELKNFNFGGAGLTSLKGLPHNLGMVITAIGNSKIDWRDPVNIAYEDYINRWSRSALGYTGGISGKWNDETGDNFGPPSGWNDPTSPNFANYSTDPVPNDGSVITNTGAGSTYGKLAVIKGAGFTYEDAAKVGFLDLTWDNAEELKGLHSVAPNLVYLNLSNVELTTACWPEIAKYANGNDLKINLNGAQNRFNTAATWNSDEGQRFLWDVCVEGGVTFIGLAAGTNMPTENPKSNIATLDDLKIDGVSISGFDTNTFTYDFDDKVDTPTILVTAETTDTGATYEVFGEYGLASGGNVPLQNGMNEIRIVVTAEDGKTTQTYTIENIECDIPIVEYDVTFNFNFDGAPSNVVIQIPEGAKVPLNMIPPAPRRAAHTFDHWCTAATSGDTVDFDTTEITGDVTFYASWTLGAPPVESDEWRVTFNTNIQDTAPLTVNIKQATAAGGLGTDFPANPTRSGYTFRYWSLQEDGTGPVFLATTPITGATTVYAIWSQNPSDSEWQVHFDYNDGGETRTIWLNAPKGQALGVSFPAQPQRFGYIFTGWFDTDAPTGGTELTAATEINANMTVFARWTVDVSLNEEIPNDETGIPCSGFYALLKAQYAQDYNAGTAIAGELMTVGEALQITRISNVTNANGGVWAGDVTSISGIGYLENLENFRINASQVTEIPEDIKNCVKLNSLQISDVAGTVAIPTGLKLDLSNGVLLDMTKKGSPLVNIHVAGSGIDNAADLAKYIRTAQEGWNITWDTSVDPTVTLNFGNLPIDWTNPANEAVTQYLRMHHKVSVPLRPYQDPGVVPSPNWIEANGGANVNNDPVPNDGSVIIGGSGSTYSKILEAIRVGYSNETTITYDKAARLGNLYVAWDNTNKLQGLYDVVPNLINLDARSNVLHTIDDLAEIKRYVDRFEEDSPYVQVPLHVQLGTIITGVTVDPNANYVNVADIWESEEGQKFLWDTKGKIVIIDLPEGVEVPDVSPYKATLESLTINDDDIDLEDFEPNSFDADILEYKEEIQTTESTIKIVPIATESDATIEIEGTQGAAQDAADTYLLQEDENEITIRVTAGDGVTVLEYFIVVNCSAFIARYDVEFDLGYTGATNTPETQSVVANSTAEEPTDPVREGYRFLGWFENTTTGDTPFDFETAITEDITLTARWVQQVTVTFNYNYQSAPTSIVRGLDIDTAIGADDFPTAPERSGFVFKGWNTAQNGSGTAFTAETPVTASINVFAQWASEVTVTFNFNYENAPTAATRVCEINTALGAANFPPNPTRVQGDDEYTFRGWNTEADRSGTEFTNATEVPASLTVYAMWTLDATDVQWQVTFKLNYENAPLDTYINVARDSAIGEANFPANPTREGFVFKEWNVQPDGSGAAFTATTIPSANTTVHAIWEDEIQVINLTGTAAITGTTKVGSTLTVAVTDANNGTNALSYKWQRADNATSEFADIENATATTYVLTSADLNKVLQVVVTAVNMTGQISSNITEAIQAQDPEPPTIRTVTFIRNNTSTDNTQFARRNIGANNRVTFPNNPSRSGYRFAGWFTARTGGVQRTSTFAFTGTAENTNLFARWIRVFNVTFKDSLTNKNVRVSTVDTGRTVASAPKAPAKRGYKFLGWSTSRNGTPKNFRFGSNGTKVTSNRNVWAVYELARPTKATSRKSGSNKIRISWGKHSASGVRYQVQTRRGRGKWSKAVNTTKTSLTTGRLSKGSYTVRIRVTRSNAKASTYTTITRSVKI